MGKKSTEDTFFDRKRPWSAIKDQVIQSYMPAFVEKVKKRKQPILLIDAFAGPGTFDDGKPGSPLILCRAASRTTANWHAVFINRNDTHHKELGAVLAKEGWNSNTTTVCGDARQYLTDLHRNLTEESLFLYLDPFGLKGCDFQVIRPYVERAIRGHIVEVIVNLSMPTLHRLATSQAIADGRRDDPRIVTLNRVLTRALGGSWWQPIMWTNDTNSRQKEELVVKQYINQLSEWLPYGGYCPVQERGETAVKYYITYTTGHPDGLALMNEAMLKAYGQYIFNPQEGQTSLWNWETGRDTSGLRDTIMSTIHQHPRRTRDEIWSYILQNHFMQWMKKEYHAAVKELAEEGRIIYPPNPSTGRRNSGSILSLP